MNMLVSVRQPIEEVISFLLHCMKKLETASLILGRHNRQIHVERGRNLGGRGVAQKNGKESDHTT